MSGVPKARVPKDPYATYLTGSDLPFLNIWDYGAAGGSDSTTAIQNAINDAKALKYGVYVPGATAAYIISTALLIQGAAGVGLTLRGDGANSSIQNNGTGNCITIGDGAPSVSYVSLVGLGINGGDATAWGIDVNYAPNTIIRDCTVAVSSTTAGAIRMAQSWDSGIDHVVIGSLKGSGNVLAPTYGVVVYNSSNNVKLTNVRIDGTATNQASITGFGLSANQITADTCTSETVGVGFELSGTGTVILGPYCESNSVADIRQSTPAGPAKGLVIMGGHFAAMTGFPLAQIQLTYVQGALIAGNNFMGTVSTTPIWIATGGTATGIVIPPGSNTFVGGASNVGGLITSNSYRNASESVELTGNMTAARTIFRVRHLATSARYRLKYYITSDNTVTGAARNVTFGVKSWEYFMSSVGAWTQCIAIGDEVAARTNGGSVPVITVTLTNGDNTGGLVQVSATNAAGANAVGVFVLEVETMAMTPTVITQ